MYSRCGMMGMMPEQRRACQAIDELDCYMHALYTYSVACLVTELHATPYIRRSLQIMVNLEGNPQPEM